ncbi:unnamed protein product [Prunus armeniaca]
MSQDNVARHGGAEGDTEFACRKTMWLGTEVPKAKGIPKAQSLYVARRYA